jgi:protein-arginine kinase activator protein McsA
MNDHYSSFTDEIKLLEKGKTTMEIEMELNEKLDKLLFDEKYEDAARVRDYMTKNKIKRIK